MITLKKKKGTRRKTLKKRTKKQGALSTILKRAGMAVLVIITLGWAVSWVVLSGVHVRAYEAVGDYALKTSANAGFAVQDILIEGRNYTDPAIIRGILNTQAGDPIFAFDPEAARQLLEDISWIKQARVERRLPGTIFIALEERQPLALWQRERRLSLIDEEGKILTDHYLSRFRDLLIVTGEGARENAAEFIRLLEAEPSLYLAADAAVRVGNRRWNLRMASGTLVKLPEDDAALALSKLASADQTDGLLSKNLTMIDMRDHERIIVRTEPGQIQSFEASVPAKKPL